MTIRKRIRPERAVSLTLLVSLLLILAGCGSVSVLEDTPESDLAAPPDYTLIFYIHGDGDYLFHFGDGTPAEAGDMTITRAKDIAESALSGEVIIYYQKPRRSFLGLFPRRSNEMFRYNRGELQEHLKYRHHSDDHFLSREAELYHQYSRDEKAERPHYFLYFGHEIPQLPETAYHQSLPAVEVYTDSFAEGIQRFLGNDNDRFRMIVLSTCSNGTPAMAQALYPLTDLLLASPQNLHLSYIDPEPILILEENPGMDARKVADEIAETTFLRLSRNIQTVITLAIYDLEIVSNYIDELYRLNRSHEEESPPAMLEENIDCGTLPFFDDSTFRDGVDIHYRAPRFGRQSGIQSHSGWGCKPSLNR
ncbi:MAG: hypothetical protein JJU46_07465 [Balneolaceae bacterium]|nr:hypothetical protein [Balneolaceae bacterium]MCH8547661.1 hypothetical protein [Balneolaceae bacterium]